MCWILAVCLAALVAPRYAWSQAPQLHLVSTAWPPFTNAPGQPQFALDLVYEALKRIGITAETAIVDEAAFTPSLLSGKFDGSAAVWRDAEREQAMVFSEPYLENRLILVGRRGSDVSATTLAALAGKRIVLVGGYSYGEEVKKGSGPTFLQSRSEEDSLARLLANEADYTLMDELVVENIMSNHGDQARSRLQVGTVPLIRRPLYLAIRRERPDAAALINRFNGELRRMIADRTYHRLLRVDWIRADVDGDGRAELVSGSDQAGTTPPQRSYNMVLAAPQTVLTMPSPPSPVTTPDAGQRFYFGGSIYEDWASVPQNYKTSNSDRPDPSRSTATIFNFRW